MLTLLLLASLFDRIVSTKTEQLLFIPSRNMTKMNYPELVVMDEIVPRPGGVVHVRQVTEVLGRIPLDGLFIYLYHPLPTFVVLRCFKGQCK